MTVGHAQGVTVATCGGHELIEDGPRLILVDRRTNGLDVALFVLGLVTFITFTVGLVMAFLATRSEVPVQVSLVLLGVTAVSVIGLRVAYEVRRARRWRPLHALPVTVVLDRARGAVCDAAGNPIAPLAGAVVRVAFQIGSSSKALELACSAGTFVIARGSPFSGSVHDIADALRARGLRVV